MDSIAIRTFSQRFQFIIIRFPYVLLCAFFATLSAIWLAFYNFENNALLKIFQSFYLGIPLFLSLNLFLETHSRRHFLERPVLIAGGVFLVLFYLFSGQASNYSQFTIFLVLALAFHLLVSFAPYITNFGEQNGFWHFNQALFNRILVAALFSSVLFSGLGVAFLALEHLFNLSVRMAVYYALAIFLLGIFNTCFFLAGIPTDFQAINESEEYPQKLKQFTLFVLFPLIITYLLVLYGYGLKILLPWNLPNGWVAYLIILYSISGIFSILLIHPIRNIPENIWIRRFSQGFYMALLPLIVLLCISIWRRIEEYGVTEPRYYVVLIALWLSGITLYFLFSRVKNIQYIPASLCVLLLISFLGPWSAVSVAHHSQLRRWDKTLVKHELLQENKIDTAKIKRVTLSQDDVAKLESVIHFLTKRARLRSLRSYFQQDLDSLLKSPDNPLAVAERISVLLGNEQISQYITQKNNQAEVSFLLKSQKRLQPIQDFDYLVHIEHYSSDPIVDVQRIQRKEIEFMTDFESNSLRVIAKKSREVLMRFDLDITLRNLIRYRLKKPFAVPEAEMTLLDEGPHHKAKLILENIGLIHLSTDDFRLSSLKARLFVTLKP